MAARILDLQLIYGVAGARDQFEALCDKLIRSEFPQACHVRVQRGDSGVDTYLGDFTDPDGIRVFQSKFFPDRVGDSQRQNIKESFERCRSNPDFRLEHWTLCLPIDLSMPEMAWFSQWANSQSASGILIDYWGASKLENLLYLHQNRGIKEAFFKEEHLSQIRDMHGILHQLIDDLMGRESGPPKQAIALQAIGYFESNLNIARTMAGSPGNHAVKQVRFDTQSWTAVGQQAMSTFPGLSSLMMTAFQSIEHANRLADQVQDFHRNPRYPSGFWNRDGISYHEIEDAPKAFFVQAANNLQQYLTQQLIPKLGDLIEKLRPHLAGDEPE